MKLLSLILISISICCLFTVCDLHYAEEVDRARLEGMRQDIIEFIGEPTCKDSTNCRSIAFGDKPCGGPWEYLIYSVVEFDTLALQDMV